MVFHPHIALLAILMTTSTVTAQEKTRIYLGASTKTRLLPSLGRHEERFLRAARPRYSTRSLARNADDSAGIGRGFVAFRLPRAGTLYRRSRASAQFHYHWGRHQRHRSIHHCRQDLQKLRRFTGRDLWQRVFDRWYDHRAAGCAEVRGLEYPRDYKLPIVAAGSSANLAALIAIELLQCVQ